SSLWASTRIGTRPACPTRRGLPSTCSEVALECAGELPQLEAMTRPRPQVMSLTEAAAERLRALSAASGNEIEGVRIGVKNGGCAGMEYTMTYAEARGPHDEVI